MEERSGESTNQLPEIWQNLNSTGGEVRLFAPDDMGTLYRTSPRWTYRRSTQTPRPMGRFMSYAIQCKSLPTVGETKGFRPRSLSLLRALDEDYGPRLGRGNYQCIAVCTIQAEA